MRLRQGFEVAVLGLSATMERSKTQVFSFPLIVRLAPKEQNVANIFWYKKQRYMRLRVE